MANLPTPVSSPAQAAVPAADPAAQVEPKGSPVTDKLVQFTRRFRSFNKNEQAGFPPSFAAELIRTGVAFDPNAPTRLVRK